MPDLTSEVDTLAADYQAQIDALKAALDLAAASLTDMTALRDAALADNASTKAELDKLIAKLPAAALAIGGTPSVVITAHTTYYFKPDVTGGKGPYSFAASNLAPGMVCNATTGELSGTPTDVGNYGVTLSVTDASSPPVTVTLAFPLDVIA